MESEHASPEDHTLAGLHDDPIPRKAALWRLVDPLDHHPVRRVEIRDPELRAGIEPELQVSPREELVGIGEGESMRVCAGRF